jgi:hypothetical protein
VQAEQFRTFVSATSDVVYRMSADWSEMRHVKGQEFIADIPYPSQTWLDTYIPPDDQAQVLAAIQDAIQTKIPLSLSTESFEAMHAGMDLLTRHSTRR